ncbi:hypothetical protein [Kurthia sibirica]|uniref:Dynamin family protein n=1 Tax=Kurthia sibirica TaxID=202750 RepID=A0A2U3ALL3_9BACL|nr:hypothetical protein [Kurthia sibirica]PWI25446.1 hypothetical protein DEX24_07510 [Kurthia sibirica]GEK34975.1 hypothetical protein KSI01_25080 [Kurthia sibirica]
MENKSHMASTKYDQLIQMGGQVPMKNISVADKELQKIYSHLQKNTNVKETAKKLLEIINDSDYILNVLLIGDLYTNKSFFINALLNRDLMPLQYHGISYVNSVIRYGEKEELVAYFLDGQIANFSVDQIELFAISDTFSSQIMRDGLDYLDIRINHPLLKTMSLFDTSSYRKSLYIRENFIKRSQATVWLTNSRFRGLPSEQTLVNHIQSTSKKLLFVVEKDQVLPDIFSQSAVYATIKKLPMSVDELRAAQKVNDAQLLEKSGFTELLKFFESSALNVEDYDELIDKRVIQWIKRFMQEMKNLMNRDPYLEAYQILSEALKNEKQLIEFTKRTEQQLQKLEHQFTEYRNKYNALETGYQLQEFLEKNNLQLNAQTRQFITCNKHYSEAVRNMRKNKLQNDLLAQQQIAICYKDLITSFEVAKTTIFKEIQSIFIALEQQILDVYMTSDYRITRLVSAENRLHAFDSLVHAQEHIIRYLEEKQQVNLIQEVMAIRMNHSKLIENFNNKKKMYTLSMPNNPDSRQSIYKEVIENIRFELE